MTSPIPPRLHSLRDLLGNPEWAVLRYARHHTKGPAPIWVLVDEAAGNVALQDIGLGPLDLDEETQALADYKDFVDARSKERPDHDTVRGRLEGCERLASATEKILLYYGGSLTDKAVHALATAYRGLSVDDYDFGMVGELWTGDGHDLQAAACATRWCLAMGELANLSGTKTMSFAVANQIPVQLAKPSMGTQASPGIRLLAHWTAMPFDLSSLKAGCAIPPFLPSSPSLSRCREEDLQILRQAFQKVIEDLGITAAEGGRLARLNPFYITHCREPGSEAEEDLASRGTDFVVGIITELSQLSPRAQAPLSILWTAIVEALDPQERGAGVGKWSAFDDDDMRAIEEHHYDGKIPPASALDEAVPHQPMRLAINAYFHGRRGDNPRPADLKAFRQI